MKTPRQDDFEKSEPLILAFWLFFSADCAQILVLCKSLGKQVQFCVGIHIECIFNSMLDHFICVL